MTTSPTAGPDLSGKAVSDTADRRDQGTIYHGRALLTFAAEGEVIPDGAVHVIGERITDIGTLRDVQRRHPEAALHGDTDTVVIPGLVDGHQHGRALSPSAQGVQDQALELWLVDQRNTRKVDPELSTQIAGIRMLLGGITSALHADVVRDPRRFDHDTLAALEGYRKAGLRVQFGIDVKDRASFTYDDDHEVRAWLPASIAHELPAAASPSLDALDDILRTAQQRTTNSPIQVGLAPRGPQWCTDGALEWVAAYAHSGTPVQTHCAETRAQYAYFAQHGSSPVRHLDAYGLLRPSTTLAHCVWLDTHDIELIAERGANVSHNPASNLRLRSGIAPVTAMRRAGIAVALGSDSTGLADDAVDLFAAARVAAALEGVRQADVDVGTGRLVDFARAGYRALGVPDDVAGLFVGGQADLVLLSWQALSAGIVGEPAGSDLPAILDARGSTAAVRDVIVAGQLVVRDGRYLLADLDELERELHERVAIEAPPGLPEPLHEALRELVLTRTSQLVATVQDWSLMPSAAGGRMRDMNNASARIVTT